MTASTREKALLGLLTRLQTIIGPKIERETVVPDRIPAGGLIILRDGHPGEPETTLSPLRHHYSHQARLEVLVQPAHGGAGDGRHAALDGLLQQIGQALNSDRTLGGAVTWVQEMAPETDDLALVGSTPVKGAIVPVILDYSTTSPLL